MESFSDFGNGSKKIDRKVKSKVKSFVKNNINSKPNYVQNDSDLWVAGSIETVEPNFKPTQANIDEKARQLLAEPHGGRSEIEVDGVTYPGKGDINDTSTWQYAGVTDGNSIIVYGDKYSGYGVRTENVTNKADSLPEFLANTTSKLFTQKGPYDGLNNAKGIRNAWTIDNRNPEGAAPLINLRAQKMAQEKNQKILKSNGKSVFPTNSSSPNSSNISFCNIAFDSVGVAYIGFSNFGGCTK